MDFADGAKLKFSIFPDAPDFWKTANGFDTLIDYLDVVDPGRAAVDTVYSFLDKTWAHFLPELNGCWFDDFGWWTIATSRAVGKQYFAKQQQAIRKISEECWRRFSENAPKVWERAPEKIAGHPKADWRPVVEDGVWNEYWKGTSASQGPTNGDPSDPFQGVQNTVTNLVYLISAQRMGDEGAATREWGFLRTWFESPIGQLNTTPLLWREADNKLILVRERVSHFKNKEGGLKPAPGFHADWFWAGDQGLLIGALVDRIKSEAQEADQNKDLQLIGGILSGVANRLADKNGLLSWVPGDGPSGYEGDYSTGTSVFWRYLLYAWNAGPKLQELIAGKDKKKNTAICSVLEKSASAALKSKNGDFISIINDIATLVAARAIL
jgi:hypothetical protein